MYAWKVSETDIRAAAEASGVAIFSDWLGTGIDRIGKTERSALKFRLALGTERIEEGYVERDRDDQGRLIGKRQLHPLKWHRRTASYGWGNSERRVSAVCWHGHYAFMRYLFALRPDARIKSAVADYRGLTDFLRSAGDTAHRNIGSSMYPLSMAEACFCSDYGNNYMDDVDHDADAWALDYLESLITAAPMSVDMSREIVVMGELAAAAANPDRSRTLSASWY